MLEAINSKHLKWCLQQMQLTYNGD